jgi:hypothetical protein
MCHLRNGAVPGIPVHDGAALASTARPRRPTEGQIDVPIEPTWTHGPTRNGGRQRKVQRCTTQP